MMANPQIPILLELKRHLEEELETLKQRTRQIESFIEALDSTITTSSFTTADTGLASTAPTTTTSTSSRPTSVPELRSIVLYNKGRELELGTLEITRSEIRAIPASHAIYDIKRGAFARFFVEKILGKFQGEDRKKVESGEITWNDAFDFEVRAEDGILEEIVIRNYGSESRLEEIERALRWSLEKIYRAR